MKKLICFFIVFIGLYYVSYSQEVDSTEVIVDTVTNIASDSLLIVISDTIIHEFEQDSVFYEETDSILKTENFSVKIDSVKFSYSDYIDQLSDSIIFYEPDTTVFLLNCIKSLLDNELLQISDSTKQAIKLISSYYKSRNLDLVLSYLQKRITSDTSIYKSGSLISLNRDTLELQNDFVSDSLKQYLFNAVNYILSSIPEDSLNLTFINSMKDSIRIEACESELDSTRINLYDKRGEYGILWIKKTKNNNLHLHLDDGIYIGKPRKRKRVKQEIDTYYEIPGLKKMKKVVIILPIWDFESMADIRFNQGYLENWAEGGENSMSALSIFKFNLNYSYGKIRNWETTLEYRLGYLKAGESPIQKNDDKIELNTKFGKTAFNDWYYSALLNFKTQFLKGYDYPNDSIPVSEFLSPAYLVFSLGLDYKPSKKLTILISPITSKFTIVADTINYDQTRFGVGQDEYVRKEIGAYVKAISKIKFTEKITLQNKINFFTNYVNKPQNIDVDWEVDLAIKFSNNIKLSVNAHLIYDDDVNYVDKDGEVQGPRLQFKEMLGVGFIYVF
jgi:hypothetical protein